MWFTGTHVTNIMEQMHSRLQVVWELFGYAINHIAMNVIKLWVERHAFQRSPQILHGIYLVGRAT